MVEGCISRDLIPQFKKCGSGGFFGINQSSDLV
jgi:hypothetical protein